MLILTRRPDESIMINQGEVEVRVLEVNGNQVRIGIEAPKSMEVDREEIYKRKQLERASKK